MALAEDDEKDRPTLVDLLDAQVEHTVALGLLSRGAQNRQVIGA